MLGEDGAAIEREDGFHGRNFFKLHRVEDAFIDEEHDALGMVDDVLGVLNIEIMQHRNDDSPIGESGHVDHHPGERIFAHDCYLVAPSDARFLKKQVQGGNASREIGVGHCLIRAEFGERRKFPVFAESGGVYLQKIIVVHK